MSGRQVANGNLPLFGIHRSIFQSDYTKIKARNRGNPIMRRTTITIPRELVEELLKVTQAKNKTQAVISAIEQEIRRRKLERIKSMAGHMDFELEAEELRHESERGR